MKLRENRKNRSHTVVHGVVFKNVGPGPRTAL